MEDENRDLTEEEKERVLKFIDEINSETKQVDETDAIKLVQKMKDAKFGLFLVIMGVILLSVVVFVATYTIV